MLPTDYQRINPKRSGTSPNQVELVVPTIEQGACLTVEPVFGNIEFEHFYHLKTLSRPKVVTMRLLMDFVTEKQLG